MRLPFQPNRWLKKIRYGSGLAVAAQNVDELVPDQLLDGSTGRLEILAGVELVGVLIEELTDGAGHGQAQIGVNVDLAHGAAGSLAQLLFGNTRASCRRWH